jgi:hypothetical protein
VPRKQMHGIWIVLNQFQLFLSGYQIVTVKHTPSNLKILSMN